jgi:hypothetical protein
LTITEKLVYNKRVKAFYIAIIIVACLLTLKVFAADEEFSLFKPIYDSCWSLLVFQCNGANALMQLIIGIDPTPGAVAEGAKTIGVALTSCFFAMAVFSDLAMFRVERIEEAIRVAMKFVIAKIIIENVDGIMGSIKGMFFNELGGDGLITGFHTFATKLDGLFVGETIEAGIFDINYILVVLLFFVPVCFIVQIGLYNVMFTLCGMLFEMGIHIAVAPIAFSTLVNEMTRQTGITFIKSYSAVCLQIFVIGVITNLYGRITPPLQTAVDTLFTDLTGIADPSFFTTFYKMIIPLVTLMIFSTAIKKSGDITKRMLGA